MALKKSSSGYKSIEPSKKARKKDYHSEKLLSGKVGSGKYNVAVSGKKGNERYSKSLVKDGNRLQRTVTSTRKTKSKNESTTSSYKSYTSQTKVKGGHHIKGTSSHTRKRTLRSKKK